MVHVPVKVCSAQGVMHVEQIYIKGCTKIHPMWTCQIAYRIPSVCVLFGITLWNSDYLSVPLWSSVPVALCALCSEWKECIWHHSVLCKLVGAVQLEAWSVILKTIGYCIVATRFFKLQPSLGQPTCTVLVSHYAHHMHSLAIVSGDSGCVGGIGVGGWAVDSWGVLPMWTLQRAETQYKIDVLFWVYCVSPKMTALRDAFFLICHTCVLPQVPTPDYTPFPLPEPGYGARRA